MDLIMLKFSQFFMPLHIFFIFHYLDAQPSIYKRSRCMARKQIHQTIATKQQQQEFMLKIRDIECPTCAQAAIEILQECCNVVEINLNQPAEDFTNCSIVFKTQNLNDISIEQLTEKINHEGFDSFQLTGKFTGTISFDAVSKKYCFNIQNQNIKAIVTDNHRQTVDYVITLFGIISYEHEQNGYTFSIIG